MGTYIDVDSEKKKALKIVLHKYVKLFIFAILGMFFGASDFILYIVEFFIPLGDLKFDLFIVGLFITAYSILLMVKYFFRDMALLFPIWRNSFKIERDIIDYIRPNDVRMEKTGKKILNQDKIYFRKSRKVYNIVDKHDFKVGEEVYIWLNTDIMESEKVIYVTKIT